MVKCSKLRKERITFLILENLLGERLREIDFTRGIAITFCFSIAHLVCLTTKNLWLQLENNLPFVREYCSKCPSLANFYCT